MPNEKKPGLLQGVRTFYKFPEATTPQLYRWYSSIDDAKAEAKILRKVFGKSTELFMEIVEGEKKRKQYFDEEEK
jgi:hypothetical protein